jgi:hypothetical protein
MEPLETTVVQERVSDEQSAIRSISRLHDTPSVGRGHRQRLLDEDVLASRERRDRQRRMAGDRCRDHHTIDRRVVDRIRCRRAHPDARVGASDPSLPLNVSAIADEYQDTQIAEDPDQPTAPAPRTDDGDTAHASADWRTPASPSVRLPAVIMRMDPLTSSGICRLDLTWPKTVASGPRIRRIGLRAAKGTLRPLNG